MTPAIDSFRPVPSIQAIATPLPVIFPTSITGAYTYAKAGQVDRRAAWWMAPTGLVGSVLGALATQWIDPTLLLLVTAGGVGGEGVRGLPRRAPRAAPPP